MNFLFLSKLLPLFFYPLGITCLLLITTLILWWKHSVWVPLPVFLALLIILLSSNAITSNWLVRSLEGQNIPTQEIPKAEAIVLLGGATKPAIPPRPMVDVNEQGDRVLYAAKLYQQEKAPYIIISGGRIDWQGDGQRQEEGEAADIKQLLLMMGVPDEAIIEEPDSLNTYENAVNVKKILQARDIKRILLVTSALHMPRSLLIFQRQGIEAVAAPTDFLVSQQDLEPAKTGLFDILPDAERLAITTRAIKEYIGIVIYRLKGWI